jgi:hypothetical protein
MAKGDASYPEIGGVSRTGEMISDGASSSYNIWEDIPSPAGELDPAAKDANALGYAANLTKQEALEKLADTRFIQDIYDYYYDKDGSTFSDIHEAIERFFSDRAWSNLNTGYIVGEALETFDNNNIQNARLARLQSVYEQMPNFYEEGGRGAEGFWQNAGAVLLDPVNILGFGFGGAGAKVAARAAAEAGKSAFKAGLWGGIKRGALTEGVIGVGTEGIASAGIQTRDINIGLQDEFSKTQLAFEAGIGGLAGAGLGGIFGALGAVNPIRPRWSALKKGKLEWKQSNWKEGQAEGLAARQEAEAELQARLDAGEVGPEEVDAHWAAKTQELEGDLENHFDRIDIPDAHLNAAVQGGRYTDPDGNTVDAPALKDVLQDGVDRNLIDADDMTEILQAQDALTTHEAMRRAPSIIRELRDQADALEAAAAKSAGDPDAPMADMNKVESLRRTANDLEAAYKRYLKAMVEDTGDGMKNAARSLAGSMDAADAAEGGAPPPDAGGQPGAAARAAPAAAVPEGTPARAGDEAAPDAEAAAPIEQEARDLGDFVDPLDETAEGGIITRIEDGRALEKEIIKTLKTNESEIKNIRRKVKRGTATPEEEATLKDNLRLRKVMQADRKAAKKAADDAQAEWDERLKEVSRNDDVAAEAEKILASVDADDAAAAKVADTDAPDAEALPDLDDAVIDAASSEGKTLTFLAAIDPDVASEGWAKAARVELRALVKGLSSKAEKTAARIAWMNRKVDGINAKNRVISVFSALAEGSEVTPNMPYGPRVFSSDLVETLLTHQVSGDTALVSEASRAQALASSLLEYHKYLEDNAIQLFAELSEGMGSKFNPGELMAEVMERFGSKTHAILSRQMFKDGAIPAADINLVAPQRSGKAVVKPDSLEDFTPQEREALEKATAMLHEAKAATGMNKAFIQEFININIKKIRARRVDGDKVFSAHKDSDVTIAPHEGRQIVQGTRVINGITYSIDKLGKVQGALSGPGNTSNKHGYTGRLTDTLKRDGEVLTGEMAAMTAIEEGSLASASKVRMVKDPGKFKETKVTNADGKKVTELSGENVEVVVALRAVVRDLRKAVKDGADEDTIDIAATRKDLVSKGLIPDIRQLDSENALQQIILESPLGVVSRFPRQVSKLAWQQTGKRSYGKGGPVHPGEVFAYKLALTKAGNLLRRTPKTKMDFGIGDINKRSIPKFEKIDGVIYEKMKVHPGMLIEQKGGSTAYTKGSVVWVDPTTNRMYLTKADAPLQPDAIDSPQAIIADINLKLIDLTQSTEAQVVATAQQRAQKSVPAKIRRLVSSIREHQRLKQKAAKSDSPYDNGIRVNAYTRAIKKLKAELRELDPAAWQNRKFVKRGVAALEEGADKGIVTDKSKAVKELGDTLNTKVTEEDKLVGRAIADKSQHSAALQELQVNLTKDATVRFESHRDPALLTRELTEIQKRFEMLANAAPATKPRAKAKPMVIEADGVEIDLNNHFKITGKGPNKTIKFLGKTVGKVTKDGDDFVIRTDDLDYDVVVEYESEIKRELIKIFNKRIKLALEQGHLQPSALAPAGSGRAFHNPNHKNTNTYKNAVEEPDTTPVDEASVLEAELSADTENRAVHMAMSEFGDDIPDGMSFALAITSGKYKGKFRHASPKQLGENNPVKAILGKQKGESFVVGWSDPSLRGRARDASFSPIDGGDYAPVKKPQNVEKVGKLKDDPDIVDPGTRPISFAQAANIEIDQATLPTFAGKSLQGKFKYLGDVVEELQAYENMAWSSPHFKTPDDYKGYISYMELLNDIISYNAPHGIKWNNASRNASMQQLAMIMRARPLGELNAVMSVLRNISGADSALPRFRNDPTGYAFMPQSTRSADTANTIGIGEAGDGTSNTPDFQKVIHEIGHWAYANILTPKDKSMFWEAMGRYITDEGVDIGSLTKRLPGAADNELHSPAEFFAQQFSQFAISRGKAGTPTELMSLWEKIAVKIRSVMERFFLADNNVDPKLIPLFERILPDRDFNANKYLDMQKKIAGNTSGSKPGRVKFLADKLVNWETIKNNIERALADGDPEKVREALGGRKVTASGVAEVNSFVQESIAYKGKDGSKKYYNAKGQARTRVGLLDRGKKTGEDDQGREVFQYMNSFHVRNKLLRAMREVQDFQAENPDPSYAGTLTPEALEAVATRRTGESELARQQEIEALADSLLSGDSDGIPDIDGLGYNDPIADLALNKTDQGVSDRLTTLANRVLNIIHEVQVDMRKQVGRNTPKTKIGEGIRVSPDGEMVATQNRQSEFHKRRALAKRKALIEGADDIVAKLVAKADGIFADIGGKTTVATDNPTGVEFSSVNEMSMPEIVAEILSSGTDSPNARVRDLNIALNRKLLTAPEIAELDYPAGTELIVGGKRAETPEDFQHAIVSAFIRGKEDEMNLAAAGLKRVWQENPDISFKSSMVNRAMDVEIAQTRGAGEENGIPNRATAEVKEILRKITHRDKKVESNSRLLAYRMMNLMGKTQQNAVNRANVMSLDDVQRLFGTEAQDGSFGVFRHAQDGPEFNQLRKTMRKMGMALKKGDGGADFIGLRPNTKGQEYTVIHEIGHLLVRGNFSLEQRQIINGMYKEAVTLGDPRALEVTKRSSAYGALDGLPPQAVQERLAEEWFVDGFANYLGNRVSKTDNFGKVKLKGRLETMVDELIEQVSYFVNGLLGNKTLRQQYRYLTFGGDMLANKSAVNTPVRSAVRNTGSFSMMNEVAPKYAQETIGNYSPAREVYAREFVGVNETEDLMNYVYYHGTPNGGKFSRATNPDVILEPSGPEALFGEGIYLTKANSLAIDYSEAGHRTSMRQMVDDANLSSNRKGIGYEYADKIAANRIKITDLLSYLDGIHYRETTKRRAASIADGSIDEVVDSPASNLFKVQKKLAALYQEEKVLWTLFADTTGIQRQPKVLPLLVRMEDTFNFDANTFYSIKGNHNDITWLITDMADKRMFTQHVGKNLIEELRTGGFFAGDDLFEVIIDSIKRGGTSEEEAKTILTSFMRDLGYDSFRVTDLDPVNGSAVEAIVVFNPAHVKHVDADVFDSDLPNMFADMIGGMDDTSLAGKVMMDQIDLGRNINPGDMVGLGAEAQRLGVPDALQGFLRRTLRREEPTMDDFAAVQRHSGQGKGGNWIRENSVHLRRVGAHWFGNIVKPEGGAGLFQKQSSDLAKKVAPLINALRSLPDSVGSGKRWLLKNQGLIYPVNKKLGTQAVPASHERIIRAMRAQDLTTLNARERIVAMDIAKSFKDELNTMMELGIPIGDVAAKLNQKYYVPQVWDTGAIQANPGKFNRVLVAHFMREARASGINMDAREANRISTEIIKRMIDTDGRIDVDNVLHRRMSSASNPFMQRFLKLTPDELPEMGEYMVTDLEGILSRYYDKTTRTINMAKEFGTNNHGADAYIHVSEHGLRGAADILLRNKTIGVGRKEMGVEAQITDEIIPRLALSEDDAGTLLVRVSDMLGSTKQSKTKNKQAAINLLLEVMDVTTLNKGQYDQYKIRVKAIVNALADFEVPASKDTADWMVRYLNVLNRKPLGSERAYSTTRKIKTFNSVSLLSWTTLTSFPDVVLPLVRSGKLGAWGKGWAQRWMGDPSYKQAARDIGVGIENLIHDNMTYMAGDGSQRFTNAFFNATLLTPWTNLQREVAALVGFNALKAEADAARRQVSNGRGGNFRHKKAMRFLKRYGLEEYGEAGGPRLDDIRSHVTDDKVRYAIMRFVNETIFTPDPNDVPMWAQTPWGGLAFQLKSFPIMMGRMSKDVIKEAGHGNVAPLALLLTAGAGFGMGANAAKDLILGRGGKSGTERKLRERRLDKTFVGDIAKALGGDIENSQFMNEDNLATLGFTPNEFLGWWVEGLLAMGGLGLVAEMAFNSAAQADNGSYGQIRVLSAVAGPSVGIGVDALKGVSAAMDIDNSSKARDFGRSVGRRIPVLGGIKSFQESAAEFAGGEAKTRGSRSGNFGGWITKTNWVGLPQGNTKKRR